MKEVVEWIKEVVGKEVEKEVELIEVIKEVKKKKRLELEMEDWDEEDGLIYYKGKVFIPKDDNLQKQILCRAHNIPEAEYPGVFSILNNIEEIFW